MLLVSWGAGGAFIWGCAVVEEKEVMEVMERLRRGQQETDGYAVEENGKDNDVSTGCLLVVGQEGFVKVDGSDGKECGSNEMRVDVDRLIV